MTLKVDKVLVTGGFGFIGRNLVQRLLDQNKTVVVVDNFKTSFRGNLDITNGNLIVIDHDLINPLPLNVFSDVSLVYHLAANADIKDGFTDTERDINQNILVTERLLKVAVRAGIKDFVFSSTAAVLGEPKIFPTPEDISIPSQTSFYGMSKLAAEGIFSTYANAFDLRVSIFRFVSVVGEYYSHGHIIDFFQKLQQNSNLLEILGDGEQKKSYLYISDILDAIETVVNCVHSKKKSFYEVYHVGNEKFCTVTESAKIICDELGLQPNFKYTGGSRGWVGDSPFVHLDTTKLQLLGWKQKTELFSSIRKTVKWLENNARNI